MPSKYIKKKLYVRNCLVCKKEFKQRTTSHIYCSEKCSDKRNNKELKVLNCLICNKEFKQNNPRRIYCSKNCKTKASYYRYAKIISKKNYERLKKNLKDPVFRKKYNKQMNEAKKRYYRTEKGSKWHKAYLKTPKARATHSKAFKKWRKTDSGKEIMRKHALKHAHTPKGKMQRLQYRLSEKGIATSKKYHNYWQQIPKNKMIHMQRRRVTTFLKNKNIPKNHKTRELVGCSPSFLKKHIEEQFKPGMNWNNHGLKGWHVDHIRALSKFNWNDPTTQFKAFHYTNLQPLWAIENLRKHNK